MAAMRIKKSVILKKETQLNLKAAIIDKEDSLFLQGLHSSSSWSSGLLDCFSGNRGLKFNPPKFARFSKLKWKGIKITKKTAKTAKKKKLDFIIKMQTLAHLSN